MAIKTFPTGTSAITPALADIMLLADATDSNKAHSTTLTNLQTLMGTSPTFTNNIDWSSGNVWYLAAGADINAFIASASCVAGDTVVLGAGTYNLTAQVAVSKKIHLMGQGRNVTNITCSTDNLAGLFAISAAGTEISDMSIAVSGAKTVGDEIFNISANCDLRRLSLSSTATGAVGYNAIVNTANANNVTIEHVTWSSSGAINQHMFVYGAAAVGTYRVFNVYAVVSNGQQATYGGMLFYMTLGGTTNIYDSYLQDSTATTGGVVTVSAGSINVYNSTLNGSGAGNFDVKQVGGTVTLYNTTLINNTTSGTISYVNGNSIAKSGNIYYSYVGEDLDALIASSKITAGDTIVLGAGTYTVTDDIDVTKGINIVGQGVGVTTVTCATASKNVFDISASNTRIADLSITTSGGTNDFAINVNNNLSGIVIENLSLTMSGTSGNYGIAIYGSNVIVRNSKIVGTSSNSVSSGLYALNNSSTTQNSVINVYNVDSSCDAGGSNGSSPFMVDNQNDANTITLNLYNCNGVALTGGSQDYGLTVKSTTTFNAIANAYTCTFSGADADVAQTGTNTLTLYDCTLVNNTTSGTITYGGTVVTKQIAIGTVTPQSAQPFEITGSAGTTFANMALNVYVNNANGPNIFMGHSRNNTPGAFSRPQDGDNMGSIFGRGAQSNSTWATGAEIGFYVDGTVGGDTDLPTRIIFSTAPDGTTTPVERMRIDSSGNIQAATTAVSNQHSEIGILLSTLTAPKAIVGFTGTGATTSTEAGYESGTGRTWTYSGGLAADKIFKGQTYVYSFDGTDSYLSTPDTADMSFGDGSNDSAFSIGGWVQVVDSAASQTIIAKYESTTGAEIREWILYLDSTEKLILQQYDESANVLCKRTTDAGLSVGWHFVVALNSGTGGATAANTIVIYVDGVAVASTATNDANYVAMENLTTLPSIGGCIGAATYGSFFTGDMGRLFVTAEALSAATVYRLYESTRGFYNL